MIGCTYEKNFLSKYLYLETRLRYDNYGHKGRVLYTVRSETARRFQIYKNHRRKCPNSGAIVKNVRPRPLRAGGNLMSYLDSFDLMRRFLIGQCKSYFFLGQSTPNQALCTTVFFRRDKVDRQKRGKSMSNSLF